MWDRWTKRRALMEGERCPQTVYLSHYPHAVGLTLAQRPFESDMGHDHVLRRGEGCANHERAPFPPVGLAHRSGRVFFFYDVEQAFGLHHRR